MQQRICVICGKPFSAFPSDDNQTCSHPCGYEKRKRDTQVRLSKQCIICGNMFVWKNRPDRQGTCSKTCGYEFKRKRTRDQAEQTLGEPLKEGIQRRLDANMTMADIARDCGITDTRVIHRFMRELGIAQRTRSESVQIQWKNNETRRAAWGRTIREWKAAHPQESIEHSLIGNLTLQTTSPTSIERKMMEALDQAGISYEFQYVIGDKFLCDLAFPKSMLIVECDGSYWHRTPKQRRRDAGKDAYLQACGYTVLRFSDKQIEQDVDACVHAIALLIR